MRKSNFELLRLFCIFGIVVMHAMGNIDTSLSVWNTESHIFVNALFNTGVTCFILISGYFGIKFRLEKLIEDLFGFTKMNYGKLSMNVGKVDIVKLLEQLLEEFYPNFAEKNLSYELHSNLPSKVIDADGNLLARLFDNLINNAIKYGADGKRVLVQIQAEEEIVTVSVTNYGYVIPEDELPLIFNKFYRVEQSRSTHTGGTGLGLAIAKSVAEMHGGSIQVKSDLDGTVFTVKLKTHFDINREQFEVAE